MFTILAAAMYLYKVLRERLPIETQHLTSPLRPSPTPSSIYRNSRYRVVRPFLKSGIQVGKTVLQVPLHRKGRT